MSSRSKFVKDPCGLDVLTRCLVRAVGKEVHQTIGGGMAPWAVASVVGVAWVTAELEGS